MLSFLETGYQFLLCRKWISAPQTKNMRKREGKKFSWNKKKPQQQQQEHRKQQLKTICIYSVTRYSCCSLLLIPCIYLLIICLNMFSPTPKLSCFFGMSSAHLDISFKWRSSSAHMFCRTLVAASFFFRKPFLCAFCCFFLDYYCSFRRCSSLQVQIQWKYSWLRDESFFVISAFVYSNLWALSMN